MSDNFVNLHVHTAQGSLLDSILTVKELVNFAKENGQKAIAVTDHGKMHSFVDQVKACKEAGIKPIIGCEVYEVDNQAEKADTKDYKQPRYHLVLLAKNETGLKNLFKVVSNACVDGMYKKPRTSLNIIEQNEWGKGIICLTACQVGRMSRLLVDGNETEAWQLWNKLKWIFDDVFMEVQSHDTPDQAEANAKIAAFIKKYNLPYTITTDAHMLSKEDVDAHSVFVEIGEGREVGESYVDCYLQTEDDVLRTLSKQFDEDFIREGCSMSVKIADMVDDIDIGLGQPNQMPEVKIEGKFDSHLDYLRYLVYSTFDEKFGWMSKEEQQTRRDRIEMELDVLEYVDYIDYFIMLYMLCKVADERGIPRGYSRGSGANCLCLFMLNVTQIDSVRWDLDFSRFANKGRKSLADFDFDISRRRRKELVSIAEELFGKESVAPIATFNSLSTKVAIKDIGKVLNEDPESPYYMQIPYELRNEVAKLIPTVKTLDDLGEEVEKEVLLKDILGKSEQLSNVYDKFPLWFKYVMRLEGLPKSMGRHAAGTLITPKPVIEYCPLCMDREGNQMCQLEMHNAMDDLSLVKMDFLGLENLDTIDDTLKMAGLTWKDVDINHLDLNDKAVYDAVYKSGHTIGIFQMESAEARKMCVEAKCDNAEDIIVVNAANRPGTKDSFPTYCSNKLHPETIKLLHPDIKQLFAKTQYILLYQEQALAVFRYAGFPETEVDNARRAIGKKKKDVMASLEVQFRDGLHKKGWNDYQISEMWALILKQASYSFNRGHAVAYGLLSYLTAYLKTHYTEYFMAACMITKEDDSGKMGVFINECDRLHIRVLPPSVNKSDMEFKADAEKHTILFGLKAIKGMGESVASGVIADRPYSGLADFVQRANGGKIGTSNVVKLIKAGAIPTKDKRKILITFANMVFENEYKEKGFHEMASLPKISVLKDEYGIDTNYIKDKPTRLALYNKARRVRWEADAENRKKEKDKKRKDFMQAFAEKYMQDEHMWEFETLSMFLTSNPIKDACTYIDAGLDTVEDGGKATAICVIVDIQKKKDKRGNQFAYLHVYTTGGIVEMICWASQYARYSSLISKGSDLAILCKRKENSYIVEKMKPYKQWLQDREIA